MEARRDRRETGGLTPQNHPEGRFTRVAFCPRMSGVKSMPGIRALFGGLAGGAFAYYHVSYYPQHTFSPAWTFDAVLMSYIGGVGTVHGPVLGALFYVILRELLAVKLVEFHLIIFGVLFMLVVLFLPGGLVEAGQRVRRLVSRPAKN